LSRRCSHASRKTSERINDWRNSALRQEKRGYNLHAAKEIGIDDFQASRWLKFNLSPDQQQDLVEYLKSL
jgi:hypothetical protein